MAHQLPAPTARAVRLAFTLHLICRPAVKMTTPAGRVRADSKSATLNLAIEIPPRSRFAGRMQERNRSLGLFCAEPFRIFFPVGLLLGIAGVSLWPLFYFGAGIAYPSVAHARLMIEGFMASFIFGFLGTAGPRITSARPFTLPETTAIFTLDLLAAGLHLGGAHRAGDICFLGCLLFFGRTIGIRFHERKDCPPPNFALVALGLLSGIGGAALVAYAEAAQYSRAYQFGSALLNQCFVLLPILGVAPFFLGRLLDLPRPDLPESRAIPPGWFAQAAVAATIGMVIAGSFLLEIFGFGEIGAWMRAAAIVIYLATKMPFRGRSFLADCLRSGIIWIAIGFTVVAFFPDYYRVGALHIVFITGFTLVAFTVAIRVVFGHSGRTDLLPLLYRRDCFAPLGHDLPLHRGPGAGGAHPALVRRHDLLARRDVHLDGESHSECNRRGAGGMMDRSGPKFGS